MSIASDDDRLNCDHPVILRQVADHPAVRDLPWRSRPPLIGGLNRFWPRGTGTVVLETQHIQVEVQPQGLWFQSTSRDPLLVVGQHGAGRTAALATDVAPHWVGPLVDWGPYRVSAQAPGAEPIEVGDLYAKFLAATAGLGRGVAASRVGIGGDFWEGEAPAEPVGASARWAAPLATGKRRSDPRCWISQSRFPARMAEPEPRMQTGPT